jgi:D-alanine--poly(phosphoribitol) ligase subunit 1
MITNILEFLENSASRFPDKTAFADEHTSCTWQELRQTSRKIGSRLARSVRPRSPIPVLAEKSVSTVQLFMGIVSAGCFYVLLDPSQPPARLSRILSVLDANTLITDASGQKALENLAFTGQVLTWEALKDAEEDPKCLAAVRCQSLDVDPLYAIFTSGSTGTPKGVLVSHRSVIDFIGYFTDLFHITEQDVIGNQAPFDFDVSVKDIYSALKTGARMEIIPRRMFSIPTELLDHLCRREVTTAIWAVSALCIITTLNGFSYRIPDRLNKILFSGEVMPVKHLNAWRQALPDAVFVNLYGPTEITCNCTYYIVDRTFAPGETLPIGRAFPNEKVFLLDEENRAVTEPGKAGEICVSGTALSLGYYRDPEKTNAAFVQNPLNSRYLETIYRTGDLAHYGEDGLLYFESRKDFQIKHMGHRIELGEIEAALDSVDGVTRSCCLYLEEKGKIAAFYQGTADRKQIAASLGNFLPRYMFPNLYRQVDVFPMTKNGKIDRKELKKLYEG